MKKHSLIAIILVFTTLNSFASESWIRINQLGYLPNSVKRAVFLSKSPETIKSFSIHDALTGEQIHRFNSVEDKGAFYAYKNTYVLDFSEFDFSGVYYLKEYVYYRI